MKFSPTTLLAAAGLLGALFAQAQQLPADAPAGSLSCGWLRAKRIWLS
jgi:hypothetical protein